MPKFNRLFIAEKASAGKSLAEFLGRASGIKVVMTNGYAEVGADRVAWMSGHLLEQADPAYYDPAYAKWRLQHLPIVPKPFVLQPKKDPKSRAGEKIGLIGKLLRDCTTVVGFGDPDAEGQLLQDELMLHLGNKKPMLRLWCNALDDSSLTKALASLKPNSEYIGWYETALSRSESDWLYGINMTRACAIHGQTAGADFKITVGRVQTPTLNLVVERELAIRRFKPVDYYIPYIGLATDPRFRASWMTVKDESGTYDDARVDREGRLVSRKDADAIVAATKAAGSATVIISNTKAGAESAPLPFSLSSLQAHCSRKFGLSAKGTLEVAQSLYLKKLTTYPRVDSDYLKESQHAEAPAILASIAKSKLPATFLNAIGSAKTHLKSRAWNDAKVTAHHAIIPTHLDNPDDASRLTGIEMQVYLEILKHYVLQFWAPAKFLATEVVLSCKNGATEELFSVNGRQYTDDGWRKAFTLDPEGDEDEDEAPGGGASAAKSSAAKSSASPTLPALIKGQVLPICESGTDSKRTTAPKRFTDGTLIVAMKSIHQYVKNPEYKKRLKEGVGIGTEATRGAILEALITKGFITMKGKDLVPSEGAMQLMAALPDIMKTPDMTAMWQQLTDDVMARRSTHADFIAKLVPWLTNLVKSSEKFFNPAQFPNAKKRMASATTAFTCFGNEGQHGCGATLNLIEGKFGLFFGCTNAECKKIFRHVDGKPVEKTARAPEAPGNPKYACQQCHKGFLRAVQRKDGTGQFWGCSNFMGGCKAIYNDSNGEPNTTKGTGGGTGGGGGGPKAKSSSKSSPKSSAHSSRGRPSSYQTPTPMPRQ